MIVCPVGNIEPNYTHGTGISSFDGLMFQTIFGSFYAGGFTPMKSYPIFHMMNMDDECFLKEIEKFKEMIVNIDTREIIKFKWDAIAKEGMPDSAVELAEGKIYEKQ